MVVADLEEVFVSEEGEGFVFACVSGKTSEDVGQLSLDLDGLLVVEKLNQLRHDFLVVDYNGSGVSIAAEVGDQPAAISADLYSLTHE